MLILTPYNIIIDFTRKSKKIFAQSLGNISFKRCCFWNKIQYDRQEYNIAKKPICGKIVAFNYLLKPNSDKEINTLRVRNNAMNYDPCSVDNF